MSPPLSATSPAPRVLSNSPFLRLHPDDNIAVARRRTAAGAEWFDGPGTDTIVSREAIDLGHKMALRRIATGEPVRKFGQVIGFATEDIEPGEWVHGHNLGIGELSQQYEFAIEVPPLRPIARPRTFLGYRRPGRKVATRNYIGIISTVNCSASTSKYIAERVRALGVLKDYPNVDGIVPIIHRMGCGMQYEGPDHKQLERTLAGFAKHPGALRVRNWKFVVVGLHPSRCVHISSNSMLRAI